MILRNPVLRLSLLTAFALHVSCAVTSAEAPFQNTPTAQTGQSPHGDAPSSFRMRHGGGFRNRISGGGERQQNICYVQGSTNPSQCLDLYLPRTDGAKKLPLIVYVHGGGWLEGDKVQGRGPCASLVRAGFAVASLNYRLSSESIFPAQIHDVKAAVRWLRANAAKYNLDTTRIGAIGPSAGGHLVSLLATTNGDKSMEGSEGNANFSSSVEAVCDEFGPADLTNILDENRTPEDAKYVSRLLGGPPRQRLELAKQASPIAHVSKHCPPFLILHGDHDETVPVRQSIDFRDALKKQGVEVTLIVIPGAGHGGNAFQPAENEQVVDFFRTHLLQHGAFKNGH